MFHLDERWLRGGFLGVDVFFTLSGFLITGLLLAEVRERGKVDLGAFWARRARRLLPAVLLLLLFLAALLPTLDPVERGHRVPELLASLVYVANWQLISDGTPYFASFVVPSPVRHLWSLAIEEQFYLVWPLVMAVVRSRRALVAGTALGVLASVAAMVALYDPAGGTRAYFGTDARVHQILIGALAAMVVARRPVASGPVPSAIGLLSVLGLGWMAWAVDGSSWFYFHGGSVLAAVLAVGVIVGVDDATGACSRLLAWRPVASLGLISYGLYLWHWPIIVLLGPEVVPLRGVALAAMQVALALAISVLSYQLVERPIREGRLGSLTLTPRRLARLVPASLATVALVVLAAGVGRTADPLLTSSAGTVTVAGVVEQPRALPATDDGPTTTVPPIRSLALVGDSVAYLWTGALADEVQQRGMQFIGAAVVSCQVGHGQLYSPRGTPHGEGCDVSVANAHRQVRELHPDVVLWHDVNASFARMSPSGELLIEGPEWQQQVFADWDKALAELKGPSTTVVLILPPWRSVDPPGCEGAVRPDRCHEVQGQDTRIRAATVEYLRRHAADPRVVGIDVDDLVCSAMPCATEIDGIRIRGKLPDLTHFTGEGARWLAPHLIDRALAAARAADLASGQIPGG